ncbi:MAG: long-chain fatty acid--CoA ligase [Hyphomicrobiales bacterium]|nr:MAG: long-chain fatty acid--CoA ligase [Hyphomicrobiales bacterium]
MIFDRLAAIAAKAPLTSGLRQGDDFFSYAALLARIERLAAGFIDRGIGKGDVVALLIPNSPDIFVVAHALFAIGAIAMPLGPGSTRAELASLAAKTGLAAIVTTPKYAGAAEALIADAAPSAPLFLTTALPDAAPTGLPMLPGNTTALYLFSSGSTGLPKVVPHTHAELIADGERTSGVWDLQPDDVMVNILPPNFAMGFLMGVMDVMTRAATTFYWSDPLPLALSRRKLLDAMVTHRATLMGAVPAMYEIIAGQAGDFDLRLRLAFSGGAALKRPVFDAMRSRFNIDLRQAYGSTEAIMVAHNDATDVDANWQSVGPPAGDAEVRIEPFETELGPDVGELLVRSSSLMQGYLGDADANAQAFDDGWFRTGDLASLDEEGRITIRGRRKLLIEISGYKIDPIEVEDVLAAHPAIAETAVIGIPDQRSGNRLRAYIVRSADISEDEIVRHARAKLSVQKVPTEIAFLDALPKSPTGKLLRARLGEA